MIHFGYEFDYDRNDAFKQSANVMPSACESIIERMMEAKLFNERPDQLTVNIYEPGNGIPSHVDTHSAFGDTITCLSLLSGGLSYTCYTIFQYFSNNSAFRHSNWSVSKAVITMKKRSISCALN